MKTEREPEPSVTPNQNSIASCLHSVPKPKRRAQQIVRSPREGDLVNSPQPETRRAEQRSRPEPARPQTAADGAPSRPEQSQPGSEWRIIH